MVRSRVFVKLEVEDVSLKMSNETTNQGLTDPEYGFISQKELKTNRLNLLPLALQAFLRAAELRTPSFTSLFHDQCFLLAQ